MSSELRLERIWDLETVRQTLTHPRIWPHISDDSSLPPEEFHPFDGDAIIYLSVNAGDEYLGLFLFTVQTGVCWEAHTALLPEAWGPVAAAAAIAAREWVWENTRCQRIVTSVPIHNKLALRFARAAGFLEYGRNPQSIERDGRLWDQVLLGISKGKE